MEERNIENIIKRYVLLTILPYVVLLTILGITSLFVEDVLETDAAGIIYLLAPSAITLVSSKVAKYGSQIKPEDRIMRKIMKVNLLTHGLVGLGFAVHEMISVGELYFAIFLLLVVAVPPFFISHRIFKGKEKAILLVEEAKNTVSESNEGKAMIAQEEILQFERELEKYEGLMNPSKLVSLYVLIMIGVILLLIAIVPMFDIPELLLGILMVIAPLVAVSISCFVLRNTRIRKGYKIIRYIMVMNVGIYFIAVFFVNIMSILSWIFIVLTFVPVFIISSAFFQKVESNAIKFTDATGRVLDFSKINIEGKLTGDSFRDFLFRLGIGNINYFLSIGLDTEIQRRNAKSTKRYVIAFDEEQVYMFEVPRNRIRHHYVVPRKLVNLTHNLAMENKHRLEIIFGARGVVVFGAMSLEVPFKMKGFEQQEEMLSRFVDIIGNFT